VAEAYPYFPPRTVHVVVVDPSVGTARRPILVTAQTQYFVAPDNGVLSVIYEREASVSVRHITAEHYFQHPVSNTFHGRDVFAPVAAWVAKTLQTEAFGEEVTDYVRFALPRPKPVGSGLQGVVLRVDAFGNLITNFTAENLPQGNVAEGKIKLRACSKSVEKLAPNFAQGSAGEPVAIIGSSGFLEIVVNKGHAARVLGLSRGAEVALDLA
jgi:S-adenosylmethionine hydrolase